MRLDVERSRDGGARLRLRDQVDDAAGSTLQDGRGEGSRLDGGDEFGVRIRAPARHLQVKSGDQRRHPVLHGAPVGDDKALEAPVVAQHLGQQPRIL